MSLYLELMKKALLNTIYEDPPDSPWHSGFDLGTRLKGEDWPSLAHTMIGKKRLDNLEFLIGEIVKNDIPGGLIETGVWRGGACIFMAACLEEFKRKRAIYCCDSFEGLPKPDTAYPIDSEDRHHTYRQLAVSLEQVKANFRRYDLLSRNIIFVPGWFEKTLPTLNVDFALLRLDGDMYGSTMVALENLYPRLSPGGYCIIDDFGVVYGCQQAVIDYINKHEIVEAFHTIDASAIYWRKS